ncbi:hypothetical protein AMS68_005678 [Peltaster fructicola]|uniref:Uncharacterized protein n=1 Tax=Peltaster fructicola TaxID=286661 RepID=A0A6H0XZR9_9PEZI|nr:hypothetical protein AMS68_005678 [Peltaster fructicola]
MSATAQPTTATTGAAAQSKQQLQLPRQLQLLARPSPTPTADPIASGTKPSAAPVAGKPEGEKFGDKVKGFFGKLTGGNKVGLPVVLG